MLKLQPPVERCYPTPAQVWHHNHYHQLDYNQRSSSNSSSRSRSSISLPKCAHCLRSVDSSHNTPSQSHTLSTLARPLRWLHATTNLKVLIKNCFTVLLRKWNWNPSSPLWPPAHALKQRLSLPKTKNLIK